MNRGSTAGFVPPLVYIEFRLFVLLGARGVLEPWGAKKVRSRTVFEKCVCVLALSTVFRSFRTCLA